MGYFSCNAESAIATCDPHCWDLKKSSTTATSPPIITIFNYTDLVAATNSFSADNFLGKGSHGSVYKATLHSGKLIAAVKTTKLPTSSSRHHHTTTCSGCGHCTSPAENEIEILSHVTSPRIVNLIGFSTDQNDTKLIVVEYMPNGSLHELLHSTTSRPPGWARRVKLTLQVARAVQALHSSNPPVIHRDIKSSNVLIDYERRARLGDFGLALRGHVEDVRVKCTPPAGTLGYLDPCYLAPEDLSAKSDVFSFGILLLEIISGRNAIDVNYSPPSVVDWAVPLIRRGEFDGICDRRIGAPADAAVVRELAVLAARCVRKTAERRPSMAEVVECVKNARRRIGAVAVWGGLRRRVARVERFEFGDFDRREEVGRVVKGGGSRRRNGKVSSVAGVEYQGESSNQMSNRVVRCKSIGSGSTMKSVLDSDRIERKKGQKAIMPGTRLKKSKSMGILQGPGLLRYGGENNNYYNNKKNDQIHSMEMAMSKLVIRDKLEEKMLEAPLVNSHYFGNLTE
ncbi:hypothetical protein RIF29_11966 [Crotalaria pallida]|uniref:Protein kinase domain-containing protein n=1 Tax=Crotalaria pallida TaxID=3830 RepID=A0AAN9P0I9_CROPI